MLGVNARQFPEKIAAMVREEMTKDTDAAQLGLPPPVRRRWWARAAEWIRAAVGKVELFQG
jgi:hypothetical protein